MTAIDAPAQLDKETENFLLDVNILVALISANHSHHRSAHNWFANVKTWSMTPLTEVALIRLSLNPEVVGEQLSPSVVLHTVSLLKKQSGFAFIKDDSSLTDSIYPEDQFFGYRQVTDFHLINLAAKSGCKFATFDIKLKSAVPPSVKKVIEVVPVLS